MSLAVAVFVRFRICIKKRWIGIGDDKFAQLQSFNEEEKCKKVFVLEKVRCKDLKPRLKASYSLLSMEINVAVCGIVSTEHKLLSQFNYLQKNETTHHYESMKSFLKDQCQHWLS